MPPIQSREIAERRRRINRPWRAAFVLYALALTTGSHWPRLQLPPEVPATDKTIHLVAFGGATVLLWRTRWIRQWWLAAIVLLGWAAIDETSQGLPGLNRTVTIYDFAANAMGISIGLAWIWALRPQGLDGAANQTRLSLFNFTVEEMFADVRAWLAGAVGLAVAGGLLLVYWKIAHPGVESARVAIGIALFVFPVTTYLIWNRLWKVVFARVMRERPCLACGHMLGAAAFERQDTVACGRCGSVQTDKPWVQWQPPSRRMIVRMAIRPALIGMVCLIAGFAFIFLVPVLYGHLIGGTGSGARIAPRLARSFGTLPPELTKAIDLTANLLLFALVTRVYRAGMAMFYDQASRCIRCGHDLRGTPTVNGIGRCGECGTAFVRSGRIRATESTETTEQK